MHTQQLRLKRRILLLSHEEIERIWGKPTQPLYEIPLIELIIRKGTSRSSRERIRIVHGQYTYKPSQSYINYVSKLFPLTKKKETS